MEQVLPALHPEGVAASLSAPVVACGLVRRALLDPESQLLPQARWPIRALRAKVRAPKEVWGNLVAHLWKIGVVEPIAIEDVFAVDGVPVWKLVDCEKGPSKTWFCSLENLRILGG